MSDQFKKYIRAFNVYLFFQVKKNKNVDIIISLIDVFFKEHQSTLIFNYVYICPEQNL